MSKFKVGDRVRIKDTKNVRAFQENWGDKNPIGKIYTLTSEDLRGYIGDWSSSILLNDNEYGTNFNEDDFELVTDSKPKFKVGDRVELIKCISQAPLASLATVEGFDGTWLNVRWDNGKSPNGEYYPDSFEIIKSNEPSNSSENKVGKIMSNVIDFVKKSLLSKEEKLLRKYGFKDSYGNYTSTADEFSQLEANKTNEVKMIEVCEKMEAEEKANK